jgi:hypothetical protein
MRAGALPPVYVPTVEDEAMRDRTRARAAALRALKAAKGRLTAFLLRPDSRDPGAATCRSRRCPRGHRTSGTARACGPSTARPRPRLAAPSGGRRAAGAAWRPLPGGRDHRGGARGPHARGEPSAAADMLGAPPRGLRPW